MYLVKTPDFLQNLFPRLIWRVPSEEKLLFLTFDDGPIPEVTPWVLDQLHQYDAKATFFAVGENVVRHPNVFFKVLKSGHAVGSHTNSHISGWGTDNVPYFHNVRRGATLVQSALFRPPYGRIKPTQVEFLSRHYHIIMWDVLSGDFDAAISAERCLTNVLTNAAPGSIVVFHDSLKTVDKLQYVLPRVLDHFAHEGYTFSALDDSLFNTERLRKRA